jgi:hypothetical protein
MPLASMPLAFSPWLSASDSAFRSRDTFINPSTRRREQDAE